jgi:hypothetical protein
MTVFRAILRQGFVGVVLAYVLAAQALLVGPSLAAPVSAAHELCLSGETAPPSDPAHHTAGLCCLAACNVPAVALAVSPEASVLPMRRAVPWAYAPFSAPWQDAQIPAHAPQRGPPASLV